MMDSKKFTIDVDRYDVQAFSNLVERAGDDYKEFLESVNYHYETFGSSTDVEYLIGDVFSSLYKLKPKVKKDIPPDLSGRASIMQEAMKTSQYVELHSKVRLDEVLSFAATQAMVKHLMENSKEAKELMRRDHLQQEIQELEELIQELEGQLAQREDNQKLQQAIVNAKDKKQVLEIQLQALPDPNSRNVRQKVRIAVREAAKEANDVADKVQALTWGTESGQPTKVDAKSRLELAKKVVENKQIRTVAELAGRLKNIAFKRQETRVIHGADEVTDVEIGDDLNRLLPAEMLKVRHKLLKTLFLKDFTEKRLMQYRVEGKDKTGRGPVICCVDTSSSMDYRFGHGYTREQWAKAVAVALVSIARKQKRDAVVIVFANAKNAQSFRFTNSTPSADLIKMIELNYKGGTDYKTPLQIALDWMKDMPKADIVFITDGKCKIGDGFHKEFMDRKKKLEFSVFSIMIGIESTETLEKFSDRIYRIETTGDADMAVNEIFSKI